MRPIPMADVVTLRFMYLPPVTSMTVAVAVFLRACMAHFSKTWHPPPRTPAVPRKVLFGFGVDLVWNSSTEGELQFLEDSFSLLV